MRNNSAGTKAVTYKSMQDGYGRLSKVENGEKVSLYYYDYYNNLTKVSSTDFTENYTYNEYGELTSKILSGAVEQTYTYAYKNNVARDLEYVGFGDYKFYPLSDVNGRNTGKEIYSGTDKIASEYITYRKVGDHATNMPATVWFGGNAIKDSIKYKYDSCGNISQITENGHLTARYEYDSLNRLIREDNKALNRTVLYAYDNNGNIVERCEYDYTSKTGEELSELECEHYSYDYEGDKLVSYNGESFAYNNLGNPTTYRNKTLTWKYGKYLASYNGTSFIYDGLGRRISKGNVSFTYDSDGRLIKQSNGLEFIYDNSGVIGVKYSGAQYFYRKDAQGNIIALLDSNGKVVVKYVYDAWGNHAIVAENGTEINSGIGVLNPFRYRGYYYDIETGLYYLQTRYYDPEVGRFISQDSIDYADPETINGLNLYAYCVNNPVMNVDPSGNAWWEFWKWDWGKIGATIVTAVVTIGAIALSVVSLGVATGLIVCAVGFSVGFAGSLISQSVSGQGINWGKAFYDGAWGIAGIAGAASGIGALGSVILGGLSGASQSYFSDLIFNGGNINYKNLILSAIGGVIGGLFAGAGAKSTILAVKSAKQVLNSTIANGTKSSIGWATSVLSKNAFKLLQSCGLYLFGIIAGQSIVLGGTT